MATDEPVNLPVKTEGTQKASRELRDVSGSLEGVGKASLAVASAAGALGGALFATLKNAVAVTDQMGTLQAASGLSARSIDALRLAASRAQKDIKEIVPLDLATKMRQAAAGSTTLQKTFAEVGISAKELQDGLSTDDGLDKILDGLQAIPHPGRRAAIAMELMGEKGRNLLSALSDSESLENFRDLSKASGLGAVDAADGMAKWQDASFRLSHTIEDLTARLMPIIGPVGDGVTNFARGAHFAFVALSEVVQMVASRLAHLYNLDFAELFADVKERGLGVQTALTAAFDATKKLEEGLDGVAGSAPPAGDALDEATTSTTDFQKAVKATLPDIDMLNLQLAKLRGESGIDEQLIVDLKAIDEQLIASNGNINAMNLLYAQQDELIRNATAAKVEAIEAEVAAEVEANATRLALIESARAAQAAADKAAKTARMDATQSTVDQYQAIYESHLQLTTAILSQMNTQTKAGKAAAKAIFVANKLAGAGMAAVNTAVGMSRALAEHIWPASLGVSAVVAAQGAATVATILAQPSPYHIGSRGTNPVGMQMAPDESVHTLRMGERVITAQGAEAAQDSRIADLNSGMSTQQPTFVIAMDHMALDVVSARQLQDPRSSMSKAIQRAHGGVIGRRGGHYGS